MYSTRKGKVTIRVVPVFGPKDASTPQAFYEETVRKHFKGAVYEKNAPGRGSDPPTLRRNEQRPSMEEMERRLARPLTKAQYNFAIGTFSSTKNGRIHKLKDLEATIAAARPQEEKDREVAMSRKYAYIEELLKHPVPDGRHRLLWLVLAPYLVTIKKMDEAQAIEKLVTYAKASGDKRDLRQVVIANVRRAKRIKLKPPTLSTLRRRHQDVYDVLPPELKQRKQK